MPTPPKPPELRQRRNKASTAATMDDKPSPRRFRLPASLPQYREPDPELGIALPWHPQTVAWWKRLRRSPMASQYLEADLDGLLILAELMDRFNRAPHPALA